MQVLRRSLYMRWHCLGSQIEFYVCRRLTDPQKLRRQFMFSASDYRKERKERVEGRFRAPLLLVASLLLVVRPGAPSSVFVPSSDALCC